MKKRLTVYMLTLGAILTAALITGAISPQPA